MSFFQRYQVFFGLIGGAAMLSVALLIVAALFMPTYRVQAAGGSSGVAINDNRAFWSENGRLVYQYLGDAQPAK